MVLSRLRRNGNVDVVLILAEENIERIRKYDPAEIQWQQMPHDIAMRRPQVISVAFATQAELDEIERMSQTDPDWKEKALKMIARGFEFRPDLGDHDFGPTVLGKPTEGTKQ